MATIHFGRQVGSAGFSRTVAIKRMHRHLVKDPQFVAMFVDEARLAARIRHPNVVEILDVVDDGDELLLVLEYVLGETISRLMQAGNKPVPPSIAASIISGALHGLHAAHEARDENGEPLHVVHRDVSPQNVMIGIDGVARVLDFGVAKAMGRVQSTRQGEVKGKYAYMPPEQLRGGDVTPRTDVYAMGIVLWEMLVGRRLFDAETEPALLAKVLDPVIVRPSKLSPEVPLALDAIVLRALALEPEARFSSAREMALAIERDVAIAPHSQVGEWVDSLAHAGLALRARDIAAIESDARERATLVTAPDPNWLATTVRAQVTVAREPTLDAKPPRRRWLSAVAISLLVTFAAAGTIYFARKGSPPSTTTASSPEPSALRAETTSKTAAPTPSSPPQTTSTAETTTAPTTGVGTTKTSNATVHPTAKTKPKTNATAKASATTTTPSAIATNAPGCNPPFYYDLAGHKIFKPECLP